MNLDWNDFWHNRTDLHYLNKLIIKHKFCKLSLIPIKLQINLIVLKLCINRNPLLVSELWKIIFDFITRDIKYFCPKHISYDQNNIYNYPKNIFSSFSFNITKHFSKNYERNSICISKLTKYINKGQCGICGCNRSEYEKFIIIDINYEFQVVCCIYTYDINDTRGDPSYFYVDGVTEIQMYTFDDFVFMGAPSDEQVYMYDITIDADILDKLVKRIQPSFL
uniref:Uncharacterized protein n=1 Tax=viral metagenome TaxID=1070528 RepID=A0A6C0CCF7_9ZZZZ